MNSQVTDTELTYFLKASDKKAFEEIYNRYWYKLFCVAYHETGSREDAEELVHDLFESLWNKRQQATIHHLSSYLVVSIKHLSTNYIKSKITQPLDLGAVTKPRSDFVAKGKINSFQGQRD
ncbi:sigma factor [Spirosoma sp.]|uniref:RNA polymerase sigma factor n=1 Tax=Spirosoma sp. TaxID=1899569 RepID=UPI0025D6339F|nr:sigma factor [Spirosoma sp.]